jgi:ATP-dependent Clp protease ATP-binding subunit ClpC
MTTPFLQNDDLTAEARARLLDALKLTQAEQVQPEHCLIAMLDDAEHCLTRCCAIQKPVLNVGALRGTIVAASVVSGGRIVLGDWSNRLIGERLAKRLAALRAEENWKSLPDETRERRLAAAVLEASKQSIQNVFTRMGLDVPRLLKSLAEEGGPPKKAEVFDSAGKVDIQAFGPSGRAVLRLVEADGRAMGLQRIGSPLLLHALAAREDGVLERSLRLQVLDPRRIRNALLDHLRALGKKRLNEEFALAREAMQAAVVGALQRAAVFAAERGLPGPGEAELLRALLLENDPFVDSFLTSFQVDLKALSQFAAQQMEPEEVEEARRPPSLAEIEAQLREAVIGQDHAIDTILPVLKRLQFGYTRPHRPMAVLLFLGNSGTGKTQLAKEIARAVYGSEEQLVFLEMGQFGTDVSKNIFVGAPPGYVGYGEGLLTNGLRDKPEAVVLFDEVEKAHKSVFDVLLRLLDEGQIADPAGPVRDARKCIIVMTSNHALDILQPLIDRQTAAGALSSADRETARTEIRKAIFNTGFFRPEFLNRVDELVLFNGFTAAIYRKIIARQLENERNRLRKEKDLNVNIDEEVVDLLAGQCYQRRDEGARVCGRLVGDLVVMPLIDFFLHPDHENHSSARVVVRGGNVEVVPC